MKVMADFLASPLAERIGLTILHSIWQLTLVALIIYLLLECLRRCSPNVRYMVSCGGLLTMVVLPVATFAFLRVSEPPLPSVVTLEVSQSPTESKAPLDSPSLSQIREPERAPSPVIDSPQAIAPQPEERHLESESSNVSANFLPAPSAIEKASIKSSPPESLRERLTEWATPWLPRIAVIWLAGFLLVTIRNVGGWHATRRLRATSIEPIDRRVKPILSAISSRFGIRRVIRLRESSLIQTPILFGCLKPVILTPIGLLAQLSNSQLEAILAHELGHVSRHDYFFNVLQIIVESLLFFHPAVWWISRRIRLEREFCCDDLAVSLCGDHVAYAQVLASIEESTGAIGAGVAAGDKPLVSRIKRVLGFGPGRGSRFSLLGISGGSLLVALFCGFSLFGTSEEIGDEAAQAGDDQEKKSAEALTMQETELERINQQNVAYENLSKLNGETNKLIESGEIGDVTGKILTELPLVSEAWLSQDVSSLLTSEAKDLQEAIAKDPRIFPMLVDKISSLEHPPGTKAAMFHIVGASDEARKIYATILASDQNAPLAIRLHQIRLLGAFDPSQLPALLEGAPNLQKTEHALFSAFHGAKTFELNIEFISAIAEYLEQVEVSPQSRFSWVPRLDVTFNSRVYGSHQMPPLWEPLAGHSESIIGLPSTASMHEKRRKAYERFCRATLRLPHQAAWGFSRLSALADLRGEFDKNKELMNFAGRALRASSEPTALGSFGESLDGPRFYSPELYLARVRWKGGAEVSEFTPAIEARIIRLEELFVAKPDEYQEIALALVNDLSLQKKVYSFDSYFMKKGPPDSEPKPIKEVLKISHERNLDGECLEMILNLATTKDGMVAASPAQVGGMFLDGMHTVAKEEGAARIDEILERLAIIYLGAPAERAKVIATLPDKGPIHCYVSTPAVVQYVDLLGKMVEKPALAFPALEKAEELGILDRMNLYLWIPSNAFENDPAAVIERLDYSPMLGDVARFRSFPRESELQFHNSFPSSSTLLDWVLVELGKLDAKSKKPFLDYFSAKKSFGAEIILATFADDGGHAVAQVLEAHLAEIKALPDSRKKELSTFVHARLPEKNAELRAVLATALRDANIERLLKFKESFLEKPDGTRSNDESPLRSLFKQLYQDDPARAIEALHLTVDLFTESLPESPSRRERLVSRTSSAASQLLGSLYWQAGNERLPERKKITEFHLRVLADERLQSSLVSEGQLLSPKFSEGSVFFPVRTTLQEEMNAFKNALEWIAEVYPTSLPEEYLFMAAIGRHDHVPNQWAKATGTPQFQKEVLAALPADMRDIVEPGLILGAHSSDWIYRSGDKPGWTDPNVAAAFDEVGDRIRNEGLPMNLRLALAATVCRKCAIHTPPALVKECAALLVNAWVEHALVSQNQEYDILRVFSNLEADDERNELIRRLLEARLKRIAKIELEIGGKQSRHDRTEGWLIGLAALLDDSEFNKFTEGRWEKLEVWSSRTLLPLLIRAEKIDEAVQLLHRSAVWLSKQSGLDTQVYFDRKLAEHLPEFLGKIGDPEEQMLAAVHLNGLKSDPFDASLPTREERFLTLARRVDQTQFSRPGFRLAVYKLLSQEMATAPFLAEGLIELVELDRLSEIIRTNELYRWLNLAELMIHSVLAAGKFDQALEILEEIDDQSQSGVGQYKEVWSKFSSGVSSGVSTHQDKPEMLAAMLPITNYVAGIRGGPNHYEVGLPTGWRLGDRVRAGNYARNIFCHALLDRMDEWKAWRATLEPGVPEEHDEFWYSHSGWAIGLAVTRTPKDASLEHRLALMKRILSQEEIVGPRGVLHDQSIEQLLEKGFFSTAELIKVGAELVANIPDGGNAKKAVEKILQESRETAAYHEKPGKFIVHEWGVQVLARAHGESVLSAVPELLTGLPDFVQRNKTALRFKYQGWDKPVIHFYGAEGMKVSVKVGTPSGIPLAYYPLPEVGKGVAYGIDFKRMGAGTFNFASGMEWSGTLHKEAPKDLPTPMAGHWWNTAREIPSAYFQTQVGSERFLFYEATAAQKPIITAKVGAAAIDLTNRYYEAVGPVVILFNDGSGLRGAQLENIPGGGTTRIAKADVKPWTDEEVLDACRRQWSALGMTEAEAAKITKVWEDDLLGRLGILLIAPMPRPLYDKMFPIEILPKPDEMVRAGLVFDTLEGQQERIGWLPALPATLRKIGQNLANPEFSVRTKSRSAFLAAGDLGLGILDELAKSDNPEVRVTARDLAGVIRSGEDLGPNALHPTKENSQGLIELLFPAEKSNKPPE